MPSVNTKRIRMKAPAKINLYLKILGKRADGYHELETLMQKIALYDELELTLVDKSGVCLRCLDADLPEDDGNIVVRAAQLFLAQTDKEGQGVCITLKKNIPVAAGLGGGSSDAAAVLNGLNQLLGTDCSVEELANMGVRLGADVPLFVYDFPAVWATGIGEKLEPVVPLSNYLVLLVNPGIPVSTQWAYAAFSSAAGKNALTAVGKTFILSRSSSGEDKFTMPLSGQGCIQPDGLENDLESVTADRHRVIGELKKRLLAAGAAGAMMSGSGPTVFGLFDRESEESAALCCQALKKEYSQVYLAVPLDVSDGVRRDPICK
ncbi:MAG: 4-(cytidine 5'-diphospho)-2-C-methyl-D-erythritol kinase [Candidatus Electrothrix sp. AR4]|nr:4-(cytidine 5'-diphospho)-2-C-methyl-D-erythritol kinase [Candidatus Electrothrix sp. AR4]